MKIVFDKLKDNQTYPLTYQDIKLLFKLAPEHWTRSLKLIHFLGQKSSKSGFERPVRIEHSRKMNLSIIDLSFQEAIIEILIELTQNSGDEPNLRMKSNRKLDNNQLKRIHEIILPIWIKFRNFQKV